jgi:cytochrome c553
MRQNPGTRGWLTLLAALALGLSACTPNGGTAPPKGGVTKAEVHGQVHVCTSCHGFDGRSISPTFPNLAGQQAAYIEAQLKAFRDHKRADPHARTYMWGMAGHLSDAMIQGIAQYFAAQKVAVQVPGDPAVMAEGERIFRQGIAAEGVPACQGCHGVHGQGMATIPRLAGQHPGYIEKQLEYFASNARANAIMHHNAMNLTAAQIEAVATYAAAQ